MLIDTSGGTCVTGSLFDRLQTTYRDKQGDNYVHTVVGTLQYFDDWLLVAVDSEVARYYAHMVSKRFGIQLQWKTQWGTHVSAIRGEKCLANSDLWGHDEGTQVVVKYTHDVYTNGAHWWLNVECDDLAAIRNFYGHSTTKRWFHLTIGRV